MATLSFEILGFGAQNSIQMHNSFQIGDWKTNLKMHKPSLCFSGSKAALLSKSHNEKLTSKNKQICFVNSNDSQIQNLRPADNEEEMENDVNELGEEWEEEELDALFDEFGETLISDSSNDETTQDMVDDTEARRFAIAAASAANDSKGGEIVVLHVKSLVYWTRYFVIATAFSRPQSEAIAKRITDIAEETFQRNFTGRPISTNWTLLDYGDVVVHIFMPKERDFYNLEEFYGNAVPVDLPFVTRGFM